MNRLVKMLEVLLFGVFLVGISAIAEEITLTTYYPAPYGSYDSLATRSLGVGDNDGDGQVNDSDVPDSAGEAWIKSKLAIKAKDFVGAEILRVEGAVLVNGNIDADSYSVDGTSGYNGSFTVLRTLAPSTTTITVINGIITSVVENP